MDDLTEAIRKTCLSFVDYKDDAEELAYKIMELAEPEITDRERQRDEAHDAAQNLARQVNELRAAMIETIPRIKEQGLVKSASILEKALASTPPADAAQVVASHGTPDPVHDFAYTIGSLAQHSNDLEQAVKTALSSLSDHACGDMEFCKKINAAYTVLSEALAARPTAEAKQVVASRMDEELEALAVLADEHQRWNSQEGSDGWNMAGAIAAEIRARKRGGRVT